MRGLRRSKLYLAGTLLAPILMMVGVADSEERGFTHCVGTGVGPGTYLDAEIPEVGASVHSSRWFGTFASVAVSCESRISTGPRPTDSCFSDRDLGSSVAVRTDHPDRVQVRANRIGVSQTRKGNSPRVEVTTGSGNEMVRNVLSCKKARVSFEERSGREPVRRRFEALARDCVCVPEESDDCSALDWQADLFAQHCEEAPEALDLVEFGPSGIVELRIRSRESTAPPFADGPIGVCQFRGCDL